MSFRLVLPSLLALSLVACSHHGSMSSPDLAEPADMTPPPDMTPYAYPAVAAPDAPQVTTQGGPVLATPKVVVITFPGDDSVTQIEDFVSTLGQTSYWATATSEYGIGPITMLKSIHETTAAVTKTTDQQIQDWIGTRLADSTSGWPQPDESTIYAIFYPATTVIDDGGGTSCTEFGGYHSDAGIATSNNRVVYAVLPRCTDPKIGTLGYLTVAASHELMEASTDPQPNTNPAYVDVDDNHFAWSRILGGGETGDMCAQETDAEFQPAGFSYYVQRNWSNKAAAAGKNPCVPADDALPYFDVSPLLPVDKLTLSFGGGFSLDTEGYSIPVGSSKTIAFQLYSDAATDPITVSAEDLTSTGTFTFVWDKTTGVNGDILNLTVTTAVASASHSGTDTLFVKAKIGTTTHYWIGIVQTPAAATTSP